jgi:uncharacterized caspase-like protein
MRRHAVLLSLVGMTYFLLTYPGQASSQPRIALIIGNAAYEQTSLRTPVNDATDMAATLQQLGFEITMLLDADLRTMQAALQMFSQRLHQGGVGLFYFAGHGVQIGGDMYLIPLGVRLEQEQDICHKALPVGRVWEDIEGAGNPLNIIILAASRNNPFAQLAQRGRFSQGGRAAMSSARGMFTAYATAPGAVALEGTERNSIYTKYLLRHMTAPGLSLESLFKHVRLAVEQETQGKQTPWEVSSGTASFYLVPESVGASPPTTTSTTPSLPAWPQRERQSR